MANIPDNVTRPRSYEAKIYASGDVNGVTVVRVGETVGVIFLGFLALCLLIALLRADARNRILLTRLGHQEQPSP